MHYERAERLSIKAHPELSEKWLQDRIAEDPSILGLGDLELRQKERIQPGAGRLDLLLQDADTKRRYEVEIQLGATDETHIIRTIEYWDIERKRYPQYDHCAVIVAEDITSRFLNIIQLFNGNIPLVALQVQAIKINGSISLIFTKVIDELVFGLIDEDEEAEAAPADRAYWERRTSKVSLAIVDELLSYAHSIDPSISLKYNKNYIGINKNGSAFNFISFRPKMAHVKLEIKIPKTDDVDQFIENSGIATLTYNNRWGYYQLHISEADANEKKEEITTLMKQAYERRIR